MKFFYLQEDFTTCEDLIGQLVEILAQEAEQQRKKA